VEAISPLIESIKEGGYIKGETLHYTLYKVWTGINFRVGFAGRGRGLSGKQPG
jgi:hypothetical protein